ncbi:MAG: site-specific integrase [Planctomycetes bacterium]|nr:site-specific integrase [Planctomycetota bacterium]
MKRNGNLRRGDTSGDTSPTKDADSPVRRRLRKTKSPAKVEGCEHRWFPADGWRYRARMKVAGKVQVGAWATKDRARSDARAMRERRESGEGLAFVTLEQACQAVLDTVRGRDGTWRSYSEHFLTICDFLGPDTPLHQVTADRIGEFLTARRAARVRGKPPSEMRLQKHLGALGRVFRLAIRNRRFAGANPLDRVERPRVKRKAGHVYDVAELGDLFAALRARTNATSSWDAAIVGALLFSGLRREGLCHVTVANVDSKAGLVRNVEQKRSVGTVVPISKPLAHALAVLVAAADDTGHLVPRGVQRGPRKDGGRPRTDTERRTSTVDRVFRRCRGALPEQLRGRFHPHTMRHSLRTILADARVPTHVKNAITDHAPATVGDRYEHATTTNVRHYAKKVLDPLLWIVDPVAKRPKAAAR